MFLRFGESAGLVHPGIMGQNGPLATNFKPWLDGDGTERSGAGQARPRSSGTGRSCLVREPETPTTGAGRDQSLRGGRAAVGGRGSQQERAGRQAELGRAISATQTEQAGRGRVEGCRDGRARRPVHHAVEHTADHDRSIAAYRRSAIRLGQEADLDGRVRVSRRCAVRQRRDDEVPQACIRLARAEVDRIAAAQRNEADHVGARYTSRGSRPGRTWCKKVERPWHQSQSRRRVPGR